MKLRFSANSIRLRLNQTEVATLTGIGQLSERVEFPGPPPNSFTYTLQSGSHVENGSVRFANGELVITLPDSEAQGWATTAKQVGMYFNHPLDNDTSLRIAVEKDFQCIDGPLDERDPAAYPHPIAKTGCGADRE